MTIVVNNARARFIPSAMAMACLVAAAGCASRAPVHGNSVRAEPPRPAPSAGAAAPGPVEPAVATHAAVPGGGDKSSRTQPPSAVPAPPTVLPALPASPAGTDGFASAYVFTPRQTVEATPVASTAPPGRSESRSGREAAALPPPWPTSSTPPAGDLRLDLIASSPTVARGEIVTVDVVATTRSAIVDSPLHLTFDAEVLAYVDAAPGPFLTQGGSSVVFLADGATRPGDVALAVGRVDREAGASGSGLLCRVRLRGVGSGGSTVSVGAAQAWGVSSESVRVASRAASVTVQ